MEYWTLIGKIRDAIKAQEDILAWTQAKYEKNPTVYIGYEEENPPPEADYPLIVIMPTGQGRSLNVDYSDFFVEIGYGIVESGKTTVSNVIAYTGLQYIMEFRNVVEDTLFAVDTDLDGSWIEAASEVLEPIELYPYFISLVAYTFKNPDRLTPLVPR